MQQMKNMIKLQVNRAIDGKQYPSVADWKPLTARQKFDVFLHSTYSPRTFFNIALDEAADRAKGKHLNREYETGFRGVGQRYGVSLATNETDVFFQRFLFPTLLKQDPRYFRNPDLPKGQINVDVSSGVEESPGRKSPEKIAAFLRLAASL